MSEKTLERPLDCREIKPVNPKGNQSWIFIGRTDAEPETPILWPPDAKNWLTGEDIDAWKDLRAGEVGIRGWDGWTASPTGWTSVWVSSGSWWWTGKPGMLKSIGSQSQALSDCTELNREVSLFFPPHASKGKIQSWEWMWGSDKHVSYLIQIRKRNTLVHL